MTENEILLKAITHFSKNNDYRQSVNDIFGKNKVDRGYADSVLVSSELFTVTTPAQSTSYYNSYQLKPQHFKELFNTTPQLFLSNHFHEIEIASQEKSVTRELLWYNRDDAEKRYRDYPRIKWQRDLAIWIAVAGLIVSIVLGWLQLQCK